MIVDDTAPYLADFGVSAVVGGVACLGIFETAYGEVFGIVGGTTPALLIPSIVAAATGTTVVISEGKGAGTYEVKSPPELDSDAWHRLKLEKVA